SDQVARKRMRRMRRTGVPCGPPRSDGERAEARAKGASAASMTLLANLVETSQRVGATSGRLAKIRELAALIRTLQPDEIETAVHYLSGELPQGRIGIGYATLRTAASNPPAATATLSVAEVDRLLTSIAQIRGSGSTANRATALAGLFS